MKYFITLLLGILFTFVNPGVYKQPVQEKIKLINKKYVHNFANLYGGAIILEKSQPMQNVDNVLQDNKDNYLLTECSEPNQYIVISLKEEIEISTIMMINQELFASTTQNFQLFGSLIYPVEEWNFIGNFTALNHNDWQVYQLQPHFVRYVKIFFQSYYQDEYFCIITQIKYIFSYNRIFGQTVMADLIKSNKQDVSSHIDYQNDNLIIESQKKPLEIDDNISIQGLESQVSLITKLMNISKDDEDLSNYSQFVEEPLNGYQQHQQNFTFYRPDSTCSYMDYLRFNIIDKNHHLKPKLNQYIDILPYYSNQSIFKVTAQNILILSNNQEILKKVVLQFQRAFIYYKVSQTQNVEKILKEMEILQNVLKDQYMNSPMEILLLKQQLEGQKYQLLALIGFCTILSLVLLLFVLKKSNNKQKSISLKSTRRGRSKTIQSFKDLQSFSSSSSSAAQSLKDERTDFGSRNSPSKHME